MHIVIVVNGELPSPPPPAILKIMAQADELVAVDGGLVHCAAVGIWPSVLLGDLDSAPPALVDQAKNHQVQVLAFPKDKDATDLELALEFAEDAGATAVTVMAAFGGRLDHELATIALVASDRWRDLNIKAIDGERLLHVVRSGCSLALNPGATVSLVPWCTDVTGVTTAGLQWPLKAETLAFGTTRGVSNVATNPTQQVAITGGVLLVIADQR